MSSRKVPASISRHGRSTVVSKDGQEQSINEQLEAIRTSLADGNISPAHFAQIQEEIADYTDEIEEHELPHDRSLLEDIKDMVKTHKEWHALQNIQLPSGYVIPTNAPQTRAVSTRLLDREGSQRLLSLRRTVGLDQQIRPDHPPFTRTYEDDDLAFRQAMVVASEEAIQEHSTTANIHKIENQAYLDALNDPATIPFLLHPTLGLPTTGERTGEPRQEPLIRRTTNPKRNYPKRNPLPDYLQDSEDEINRLLKKIPLSNLEFASLERLLRNHEPESIRVLYKDWQASLRANGNQMNEVSIRAEKEYEQARQQWLSTFKTSGVYLVLDAGGSRSTIPGVFIVPKSDIVSRQRHLDVGVKQRKLDLALAYIRETTDDDLQPGSFFNLDDVDIDLAVRFDLAHILLPFAPTDIKGDHSNEDVSRFAYLGTRSKNSLASKWGTWIDSLVDLRPQIVLLKPGEMQGTDPSILGIPWEPTNRLDDIPFPPIHNDKGWTSNLQALLQKKRDPSYSFTEDEEETLLDLISDIPQKYRANSSLVEHTLGVSTVDELFETSDLLTFEEAVNLVNKFKSEKMVLLKELAQTSDDVSGPAALGQMSRERRSLEMQLSKLKQEFLEQWWSWYCKYLPSAGVLAQRAAKVAIMKASRCDFSGKAQRRGVNRAATELALNLLATNQEQHRVQDRFRIVRLPSPYRPPQKEVALSIPLDRSQRPVEQDTFEFTKKLAAIHLQQDEDYKTGRDCSLGQSSGRLIPHNFNGPFTVSFGESFGGKIRERQRHLQAYYALLERTQREAPRPLLQRMLHHISLGLGLDGQMGEEIEQLTETELALLEEIGQESWMEEKQYYEQNIAIRNDERIKQRGFKLFEAYLKETIWRDVPFWQPAILEVDERCASLEALCTQSPYNADLRSSAGFPLERLVETINNMRSEKNVKGQMTHSWTSTEGLEYLQVMAEHRRIHLDETIDGQITVSKIPFTGHPENKYVTSQEIAFDCSELYQRNRDGSLHVQYNSYGQRGPVIVQPNKYEHIINLSERLGREIRYCLDVQAQDRQSMTKETGLEIQMNEIQRVIDLMNETPDTTTYSQSVEDLAHDINQHAPDLAQGAMYDWSKQSSQIESKSFDEWQMERNRQCASVVQMKVLEEVNNNWESLFPENEHVWDFASERIEPTYRQMDGREVEILMPTRQFFSMRRWPVECQSSSSQTAINNSGPEVASKSKHIQEASLKERSSLSRRIKQPKQNKIRHIKGRAPRFPFGETPFQRAWLSYQIERDLAEVPEFQVPAPEKKSWFSWARKSPKTRASTVQPFSLPKVPATWIPDNVSKAEKKIALVQYAAETAGFPTSDIPEYYFTQEEIQLLKQSSWTRQRAKQAEEASVILEAELRKPPSEATQAEIGAAIKRLQSRQSLMRISANNLRTGKRKADSSISGKGSWKRRKTVF